MKLLRNLTSWLKLGALGNRRVRECVAVLPVIRAQLQETCQQMEESVVGVCSSFTGIATRARAAVTMSSSLLDGPNQEATVESSIDTSRRTIASLLERMERATKLSSLAVASMEEVARTVTGIEELLQQVQRIAFTNKLVALNAKIEAVHVGEVGSGFEVVADEISRQAERSSGLAEGIAGHINGMRTKVDSVAAELRVFLAEDSQKLEQSRTDAEGALTMLLSLHQRTLDSLAHTTQENGRLADEIAAAVVGLQFQDRVKQRIGHVVEALNNFEAVLGATSPGQNGAIDSTLLSGVQSSYTMESERAAHQRATAQTVSHPEEMEVELF